MDADTLKFIDEFQSTPSTRRETLQGCICQDTICISIHSLHTEGDKVLLIEFVSLKHFNPLPPHGGRLVPLSIEHMTFPFQSTPSTRRETKRNGISDTTGNISIHSLHTEGDGLEKDRAPLYRHFNPLPPHGGRPGSYSHKHDAKHISIHSLHTEGDEYIRAVIPRSRHFNPLPPHGGRPFLSIYNTSQLFISIHSLHTEGDHRRDRLS